jgi:hypothetical protein
MSDAACRVIQADFAVILGWRCHQPRGKLCLLLRLLR